MFKKHPIWVREKFQERFSLFLEDMYHPLLNNHPLEGEWIGCRSINITGDIRAVFEEVDIGYVEFIAIGTHSELYS